MPLNVCCNWVYTAVYSTTFVSLNTTWGADIVSEELINESQLTKQQK